ncbi:TPR-like protein [Glarea lozoyensis ATCC 20868]|uniref:TPR-like protein n=1 Tax=Glarea lozoyensis (strain ATCC 20868 / MF5171) TaxID=1116229 RepID=S3D1D3_GLAL2|nr:TPR-like protein [Glarea lozoyensis ATCC 20868]EPE25816.1 TPR-like protein [Glarea lozoyensis ATCC 20868]
MLERTAGCFETGSLRRLLPSSGQTVKGRRALHSAFFNHAAGDNELSTIWSALVQGQNSQRESAPEVLNNAGGDGGIFLDFLYPTHTINSIRKCSLWALGKQSGQWGKSRCSRLGQRAYTSSATTASPTNNLGHDVAENNDDPEPDTVAEGHIYQKLGLQSNKDYDEAWRQYSRLDKGEKRGLRCELIEYLSTSTRIIDAERIVDAFSRGAQGNTAAIYKYTIRAHLSLRNADEAIRLSIKACNVIGSPVDFDNTFCSLAKSKSWSRACSLWNAFTLRKHGMEFSYNLFRDFERLWNFDSLVCDLIGYADQRARATDQQVEGTKRQVEDIEHPVENCSPGHEITHGMLVEFSTAMALHMIGVQNCYRSGQFKVRPHFSTALTHLRKYSLIELASNRARLEAQIDLMMDLGATNHIIDVYRALRDSENFVFSAGSLDKILRYYCAKHNTLGIQTILDDVIQNYGRPTRIAYRMVLREFANRRDVTTVQTLFDRYMEDYFPDGAVTDPDTFAPILQVYSKRGEVSEVMKNFNLISDKYGLKPSILCWNIVIAAHGRALDADGVYECFDAIVKADGIKPDDYTFGSVMGAAAIRGDLPAMQSIYRMAQDSGVSTTAQMVDCLVKAHIDDDDLEAAESICIEAVQTPMKGSRTRMWNYLIVAHALRRDLDNANRVLRLMPHYGVPHNEITYAAIMQALAMVKLPDAANKVMNEALPRAGFKPSALHYAILMGAYLYTNQIPRIFRIHRYLLRRHLPSTASTNAMLMRAQMNRDEFLFAQGTTEHKYERALEMFLSMVWDKQDHSDIEKGMLQMPLDHKYATSISSFVITMISRVDEPETALRLFRRFLDTSPDSLKDNVPSQMISALLYTRYRQRDAAGIQKCWDMIMNQSRKHMKPTIPAEQTDNMIESPPTGPGILNKYRTSFAADLNYYLAYLSWDSRQDEMIATVNSLLEEGFVLDNRNWNNYVKLLLQGSDQHIRMAFELCEDKLMGGFLGWALYRRRSPARNKLPLTVRYYRKDPRHLRPLASTSFELANAFIDLQAAATESPSSRYLVEALERRCPKTVGHILTIPSNHSLQEMANMGRVIE